jgi:polar amino acid transport system substrate-binding protein
VRTRTGLYRLGLVVLVCATLVCTGNPAARELVVGASPWPPYDGEELPQRGMSNAILGAAFERAGHKLTYVFDMWHRTLEGARMGVFDLLPAVWHTQERARDLEFSEPYLVTEVRFLKRRDSDIKFNQLSDLEGYMIGVVRDYAYGEEFNEAPGLVRVDANFVVQNLFKLAQRQIDLTVGDQRVLTWELSRQMPETMNQLEFLPKPLDRRDLYIAVSLQNKDHDTIVKDFNKAIKAMKADGSYDRIVSDYEAFIASPKVKK